MDRDDRFQRPHNDEAGFGFDAEPAPSARRRRDRSEDVQTRLVSLLDDVESIVERGTRIPFTAKVLVDRDVYLDTIDSVRIALPESVVQAERIVRDKELILTQADAEAERIVSLAREQQAFLISERQLLRTAELQSEAMLSSARDEAKEIIASAQKFARDLLLEVEGEAERVLGEIRKAVGQVPQSESAVGDFLERAPELTERSLRVGRAGRSDRAGSWRGD